jgi:hypothetical protein
VPEWSSRRVDEGSVKGHRGNEHVVPSALCRWGVPGGDLVALAVWQREESVVDQFDPERTCIIESLLHLTILVVGSLPGCENSLLLGLRPTKLLFTAAAIRHGLLMLRRGALPFGMECG